MNGRNVWTPAECAKLEKLGDDRGRFRRTWDDVAAEIPGRTKDACMVQYYYLKRMAGKNRLEKQEAIKQALMRRAERGAAALAKPPSLAEVNRRSRLSEQTAPPVREIHGSTTAVSTALLLIDSELRSRIAVLGPTGGMLGDPLPGRSALHMPRAKEWCGK